MYARVLGSASVLEVGEVVVPITATRAVPANVRCIAVGAYGSRNGRRRRVLGKRNCAE